MVLIGSVVLVVLCLPTGFEMEKGCKRRVPLQPLEKLLYLG
jgi:hypothetical protein